MQISQFVLLLVHCMQPILFLNRPECKFAPGMVLINIGIGLTFMLLFLSFYKQTYSKKPAKSIDKADNYVRNGVDKTSLLDNNNKSSAKGGKIL